MTEIIRRPQTAIDATPQASQLSFKSQALQSIAAKYVSKETRKAYAGDLGKWLDFCDTYGLSPYLAQPVHAATFRELQLGERETSGVHRTMAALSAVYKLLQGQNGALVNPFHQSTTARPSAAAVRPRPAVSEEDAVRMLQACQRDPDRVLGTRDEALLALLWSTGIRRNGVCQATTDDWQLLPTGEGILRVLWKGGRRREVRCPQDTAALISRWLTLRLPIAGALFTSARGGGALTGQAVYEIVKNRATQAGVDSSKIMPHGFRAGLITRAYEEGLPEVDIQAAAGHARADTTRSYDRGLRGATVTRQVGRLPGGDK